MMIQDKIFISKYENKYTINENCLLYYVKKYHKIKINSKFLWSHCQEFYVTFLSFYKTIHIAEMLICRKDSVRNIINRLYGILCYYLFQKFWDERLLWQNHYQGLILLKPNMSVSNYDRIRCITTFDLSSSCYTGIVMIAPYPIGLN